MEKLIELNDTLDTAAFYGVNNRNMQCLKNLHPDVRIIARGNHIKVNGTDEAIRRIEDSIHKTEQYCQQHGFITEKQLIDLIKGNIPTNNEPNHLIVYGISGKAITARTPNQQRLAHDFEKNDLLFAIGPAGSGKTYTAIALAVKALKNKEVRRIILSRPAVEAGEKLGFLPGDMREKIDPYLQPLYDALQDMLPAQKLNEYMERGIIQIAPLAFMRGRTLSDAVVILDEAQNTTIPQLKMFLTRMGFGSKMIVTGDLTQVDLPNTQRSGLSDAIARLDNITGISIVRFNEKDIVRHPIVNKIVTAYSND